MQHLIKRYGWVALLAVSAPLSWGFALIGPLKPVGGDAWQTAVIGYDEGGDVGTPRNLGEEYRRNTPVLYYAYDYNFSSYFGSNGEAAVDSAIAIMNGVGNVDSYTPSMYELPMDSQITDYSAQALGLTDLKSFTLPFLLEQLGLAEPERYTWTLHSRYLPPGGVCPANELYTVVQRNYDPITSPLTQQQYSSYVNGTLYTYVIDEACTGPNPLALAAPFSSDPYADTDSAVAGLDAGLGAESVVTNGPWAAIGLGGVYEGLTRDDVAGLRYLYSRTNVLYETAAAGALQYSITTNTTSAQLFPNPGYTNELTSTNLFGTGGTNGYGYYYYYDGVYGYGDYAQLLTLSQYNPPLALEALYPGLVVSSSSNYFILATNITVNYYFTNLPGSLLANNPVIVPVYTTNYYPLELYVNKFANVFTNHLWSTNSTYTLVTNTVGPQPGKLIGVMYTNTTSATVTITNLAAADFFVLPQFYPTVCPLDLSYPLQTNVLRFTNILSGITVSNVTTSTGTNITGGVLTYASTVSEVVAFTNYTWVAYPVTCAAVADATGWYQGVGGVQFVREPDTSLVDPLTDEFVTPITNNYTMVNWNPTNNSFQTQYFQRILVAPDILFDAVDQGIAGDEVGGTYLTRSLAFNEANHLPGLAGPGTILADENIISYNKVGDIYGNGDLAANLNNLGNYGLLSQYTQVGLLAWGSFDGTTNPPVVYPNGTSLGNLQSQLVVTVTTTPATVVSNGLSVLPNGTNNQPYSVQFSASGGVSPYTWSLAPGSNPLPNGLSFSAVTNGQLSGTVSGAAPGVYDFTVQVMDSANRVVDFSGYTIDITN